jgi:IS30 family transposase
MRIGRTREQQQHLRQQRRERAAQLVKIGLTHKQIAERLGVAGSTVAPMLAEGTVSGRSTVAAREKQS